MRKFIIILLFFPIFLFSQINYNITVNSLDSWNGNLFYQRGGNPPGWTGPYPKPVKILDVNGVEIFSQNWQKKVGILK